GDFLSLRALRETAGDRAWWTLSAFDSGAALPLGASAPEGGSSKESGPSSSRPAELSGSSEKSGSSSSRPAELVEANAEANADTDDYIRIEATSVPSFTGQAEGAIEHVASRLADGWAVAVTAQGSGLVERAAEALSDRGLAARSVDQFPAAAESGVVYLLQASVEAGFESAELKLALLSESEFYGRTVGHDARQVKKLASRRRNVVDPLQLKT